MNTVALSETLKSTTRLVNLYMRHDDHEPECISGGSACVISAAGHLLTAAHVVDPAYRDGPNSDLDPDVTILAKGYDSGFLPYTPHFSGYEIDLPGYLTEPLRVDVAILTPAFEPELPVPYLPISGEQPPLGSQVLLAGYPDDMEMPFSLDRFLDQENPEIATQRANVQTARNSLLMITRGMVGHCTSVTLQQGRLRGWSMYIDNALHSGASGGPVINEDGQLVGFITDRAITSVAYEDTPRLRVPSGACLALSPSFGTEAHRLRIHLSE